MIIQYASDLHLEFSQNKDFLRKNPLRPIGEILLLAGDVVPFAGMDRHQDFFDFLSDQFETTYWIPGNHEYYYFDVATKCGTIHERIRKNVHLVNNLSLDHKGIHFIFSTLWSKINPDRQWYIEKNMSDFQVIQYEGHRFSLDRFNQLHEKCLHFLNTELRRTDTNKTIVVTHHVPTFLNYPEKYEDSELNEAFGIELFDFIEQMQPAFWIYGHHHCNVPDFNIGKTRLVTNQVGYVKLEEHHLFNPEKAIQI